MCVTKSSAPNYRRKKFSIKFSSTAPVSAKVKVMICKSTHEIEIKLESDRFHILCASEFSRRIYFSANS